LKEPVDCEAIRKAHHLREAELIEAQAAMPGVVDIIQQAHEHKLMVGIASSSERSWVIKHLRRLGLDGFFQTLCCLEDVAWAKPAPDLYLALLEAWKIRPDEAFAFEDSPHGVSSAKRAGLFCVAVPNEMTRGLCFDHADLVLDSLEGINLDDILRVTEGGLGEPDNSK
jgi:HAD superfamily hydrolase (TIGR01509 family)